MNLQTEINNLFSDQQNSWSQLQDAIKQLDEIKTKPFNWGNEFSVNVQFNPARITSTAAKTDVKHLNKRPCFLCETNRSKEQRGITFLDKYIILCNPFPILRNHLTIPLHSHVPQRIRNKIADMLTLAQQLNDYVVFYNGPKCGASAPDHFHLQAGLKQDVLLQGDNELRSCMMIVSENRDEIIELFEEIYLYLRSLQPDEEEPMLNVIVFIDNNKYKVHIFPRSAHRPTQFYKEGSSKLMISPGALDLAGLIITVREEDFKKIDKTVIEDIYSQVSLPII